MEKSSRLMEKSSRNENIFERLVVVAQLVEQSLPTPQFRGSKPVIGKFYLISTALKRRK